MLQHRRVERGRRSLQEAREADLAYRLELFRREGWRLRLRKALNLSFAALTTGAAWFLAVEFFFEPSRATLAMAVGALAVGWRFASKAAQTDVGLLFDRDAPEDRAEEEVSTHPEIGADELPASPSLEAQVCQSGLPAAPDLGFEACSRHEQLLVLSLVLGIPAGVMGGLCLALGMLAQVSGGDARGEGGTFSFGVSCAALSGVLLLSAGLLWSMAEAVGRKSQEADLTALSPQVAVTPWDPARAAGQGRAKREPMTSSPAARLP